MARKQILSNRIIAIVRRYGKALRHDGIPFVRLIVFGSQVKGTARTWSDIDVCVVSNIFGKDRHTERVRLMHVRKDDTLLDIEPHPYNPKDLDDKFDPLAYEIRRFGVKVV